MEVQLKRGQLLELYQTIVNTIELMDTREFQERYKIDASFSWGLAKNEKLLEPDVKLLKQYIQIEPDKEFDNFEQERQRILSSLANKDEKGNPVTQIVKGQIVYSVPTSALEEWNKQYKILEEQYKDALKRRDTRVQEINQFLDSEEKVTVTLYKIDSKTQQDGIPPSINRILMILYDEGVEQKRQIH